MSFGSSLEPILERCSLSREVKQNPFTRVKISCFTLHRVFVATSKLKMTAGMAFQTTKYSGLNFRKFPAWKRTTFSEIFRIFRKYAFHFPIFSEFPFNGSHFWNSTIFWVSGNFPWKFQNLFALKVSKILLVWKAPRINKTTLHMKQGEFWNQMINIFLLSKPYQVGVPPPTHCRNTQLSWSVHLGRLCQQLSWSKPLPHCSSGACSLHRNPKHLEPAESPGHQRRKKIA